MNCLQCTAPLEDQARFCRKCGSPVAIGSSPMPSAEANAPTIPTPMTTFVPYSTQQEQWQSPLTLSPSPQWNQADQLVASQSQAQWMPPPYSPPVASQPGSMRSAGTTPGGSSTHSKRKWPLRLLITLIILLVLLTGGWFFVGRPILHSVAQNQFDQLVAGQINTIPPVPVAVASSLAITENQLNNLITLNHAPSDPVQNAVAHIAPQRVASDSSYTGGIGLDFQLFGFACSIKGIPVASNGQITMTQVQVSGILSLVMSSDEMTTLLNGHLHDAFARLNRQVTSVTLKNQEFDIQLGSTFV